ncbi:MAG: 4Fe-4S binding protein [Negativicutes bacterium]|nr:4Fe-4S binding protein [Negativicutes bacterium]
MVKNLPVVPSAKAGSMADAPSGIVWREQHPAIGAKCNQCLVCTLFCPEGALLQEAGKVIVALKLCNGCGTCAVQCPQKAIVMEPEFEGDRGVFPLKEAKK